VEPSFRRVLNRLPVNMLCLPRLAIRASAFIAAALAMPLLVLAQSDNVVSFNEIHYHPTAAQTGGEWVELKNRYAVNIDLSRWKLAGGIDYTFPQGTVLPAKGLLVIAANPSALQAATGITGVLGPFTGQLSNGGERIALLNNSNRVMDEVTYATDGAWPTAADGGGATLARRGDNFPSDKSSSWRASEKAGGTPGGTNFSTAANIVNSTVIPANGPWKYRADGADLGTAWRSVGASEAGWSDGTGAFQLGSATLPSPAGSGTALPAGPVTYYFRRTFDYGGQISNTTLELRLLVDDGAAAYLNGTEIARMNLGSGVSASGPALNPVRSAPSWRSFTVPASLLQPTGNVLAVEVHQARALPAYAAAVIGGGPVAYWRLGEATAATGGMLDLAHVSGPPELGGQDGTLQGLSAASLTTAGPRPADLGPSGQPLLGFEADNVAPTFLGNSDGGDDAGVFPDPGVFNFAATGQRFTLEAWFRGAATQEGGGAIVAKGNGGNEQFNIDFAGNRIRYFVRDQSGTAWVLQTTVAASTAWQHLAATCDGPGTRLRFYLNGLETNNILGPATLLNSTAEVSIGGRRQDIGVYNLNFNGSIDEVAIYGRVLSAAEIAAHYNAAYASAPAATDTTDAVFAAELNAAETIPAGQARGFVLNEVSTSGVELANLGGSASTTGLTVARVNGSGVVSNAVAIGDLAVGGFGQVPLALADGDRVVLFAADGQTILDSTEVKKTPRSRFPDGTGAWARPVALTPGTANQVTLTHAVAINEIMFDPPSASYFPAGTARAGKWVELKNRTAQNVDLSGWAFTAGIDYVFPTGATLPANGYVVVAENPAQVIAVHGLAPASVFGPWSGGLSGRGDRLALADASENPADEVRYAGGGRWPTVSDGGGSSLELRDANADHSAPEAWAASSETAPAGWQTFTWSGVSNSIITEVATFGTWRKWNEIELLLVDGPGELLIDDVKVIDTTTSANLVQNGDFSAGAAHWRFVGNHRTSRVEAEPGNPANQVLHLIASGSGEYQGNQLSSTFLNDQALVQGRTYTISLRARWLSGGGRLNSRLYFNRIPKTNTLALPPNGGTPGAANSRAVTNAGPTFSALSHSPIVPDALQPVQVSVNVADPLGTDLVQLKYAVAGGTWQTVAMTLADGRYTGTVPGQTAGKSVQFYVTAHDPGGVTTSFPARGPDSRALYVVQDGRGGGASSTFRLVMTQADAVFLHTSTNAHSNELLGATIIGDDSVAYYDVGVRLKASFIGRYSSPVGFNVVFGPDQLFRGTYDKVAVDRADILSLRVSEIILKHVATAAGGIPGMYDDITRFIHPLTAATNPLGVDMTISATLRLAGFDEIYLDSQFPNGSAGQMFEVENYRQYTQTVDGNPESTKRIDVGAGNGTSATIDVEMQDYGPNPDDYRWMALQGKSRGDDDYSGLIDLYKMFSLSGTTFVNRANQLLDVDSCLRTLALQSLFGVSDSFFIGGTVHNFRLYIRPNDRRAMIMPWDWDAMFLRPSNYQLIGQGNAAKIVTASPDLTRRYYAQLADLIATTFNTSYMATWVTHYGSVAGQNLNDRLTQIGDRASYVTSQLPGATTTFTAAAGTVAPTGSATISGTANLKVTAIEVNGTLYTPVWSSNTNWSIVVPLANGSNALAIKGWSLQGALVAGQTASVNVSNPYVDGWPALQINEWLAENDGLFADPADGASDDWFEIRNPTASAVNLSGWKLTDLPGTPTPFVIPNGWTIPAGGFLLVWADNQPAQTPASPVVGSALHASFKLDAGGDTIQLLAPDGREIDRVTFGKQKSNRAEGRDPANPAAVGPLTLPTPAQANVLTTVLSFTVIGNSAALRFATTPGIRYQLEWSQELSVWNAVGAEQIATTTELTLTDPARDPAKRFYRLKVRPSTNGQ
jgi:hypothetical protein